MPTSSLKVMSILGTRPEIIRLSETMKRLDEYIDHTIVFTGQSHDYEMSQIFFDELGIREPDHRLEVKADSLGEQIGNIIARSEQVMREVSPDVLLVLGDTNSALSCITARRLGIKIVHMEAGNRCWDSKVPEETNRRIVDHTADVNICYTEHARRNLLREGLHPKDIFVLGTPLREVYSVHDKAIRSSAILSELGVEEHKYLLASVHREENVTDPRRLHEIIRALGEVGRMYGVPVIFTTHPRTRRELEVHQYPRHNNIVFHKPFGMIEYVRLQLGALCNLSDSGTIHEDAALLGIPAVNLRDSNERPEVYDTGGVIMAGVDSDAIVDASRTVIETGATFALPTDYAPVDYSVKAVRLIMSMRGR